ncbi:MAG: Unknown protein [uncultured Sulfurovum sp.]|uniref:SCP domain-containing protein n=1 Tax=uncultured Sulfurovum sp. TaxID=269237 RepID=A0A6S6TSW2_9BACT|nr:MAG: Unknown protein [uncultured Sulfurovum sp.]
MRIFHFILFLYIINFVSACGESKDNNTSPLVDSTNDIVGSANDIAEIASELALDLGIEQWVKVNENITLNVEKVSNTESVSSYKWEYEGKTLATTREFTYTPTTLGVNTLDFSVQYSDGTIVNDTINIIVTSIAINLNIPTVSTVSKEAYISAINAARAQAQDCGSRGEYSATTALTWSDKLYSASYEHLQDLVASQTFAHKGSGTESDWTGYKASIQSDLISRSEAYGYIWSHLGENLAGGTSMDEVEEAINAWLESDSHCENLMDPNFTEVGMAMIKDDNSLYTHYWSQNFGTPK